MKFFVAITRWTKASGMKGFTDGLKTTGGVLVADGVPTDESVGRLHACLLQVKLHHPF